jgi:hypothetical protein
MMVNARKCASLGEGPAAACAAALGKARREGHNWRCICPLHGGQSLTVADGRNGRLLVRCWAGCEARDILAELRRMGLNAGRCDGARAAPMPVRAAGRDDTARRSALARRLWDTAQDARGSPVTDYLARRGIIIPPPPSLRWEPRCWPGIPASASRRRLSPLPRSSPPVAGGRRARQVRIGRDPVG